MAVDNQGYIYIGDSEVGITRLQYSNITISSVKILNLNLGVNKLAAAKINNQQQLFVQTNSSVISYSQ